MSRFTGKRVLVVGGGSMGGEVSRAVAAEEGTVFFTYNSNIASAESLSTELAGSSAGYQQLDISDDASVAAVVTAAADAMGGIDVLVITTGYVHDMTPFADVAFAEMRRTIEVELIGLINVSKKVVPHMTENGYGRIVFIGSDSGKVGSKGEAASSAARGGVIAFAKALGRETARHDICVNVVCPGPTEGPMLDGLLADPGVTGKLTAAMMKAIPKRRAAKTSEIAAAVLFLASGDAGYITGQALSVSGGLTMS